MNRKSATLKDIAGIANVSITTVSKSLSNHSDISTETKERILKICEEVHYVPNAYASSLRRRKGNLIGVVISDNTNPYYAELLRIVESELSKQGYYTIIFNTNDNEETELRQIESLRKLNVEGALITPTSALSIERLRSFEIPFVQLSRYTDKNRDNYVVPDDTQAGYLVTLKALEKHPGERFHFLGSTENFSYVRERIQGFLKALNEAGVVIRDSDIIMNVRGNAGGYRVASEILEREQEARVFVCESDFVATGVLKYLAERGISVPEKAGVVGFDNLEIFSYVRPRITSVDMKKDEIGRVGVEILLKLLEAREREEELKDTRRVLTVSFVEGETC